MTTPLPDEQDYPYQPHSKAARAAKEHLRRSPSVTFWPWIKRILLVVATAAVFLLIAIVIVLVRGFSQAQIIAELQEHDAHVIYRREPSWLNGWLPDFIRENERWWAEVEDVTLLGAWSEIAPDDVRLVCEKCGTFKSIRSFTVAANSFSCSQISDWPSLKTLERLDVTCPRLSTADFAVIGRMTALKGLRLESVTITCEALQELATLPNLEYLTLEKAKSAGECNHSAANFRALKSLVVSESPDFGDEAFKSFGVLPQIEHLVFNRVPIGDEGLAHMLKNIQPRELGQLIIRSAKITDAATALLAKYRAPRSLVLTDMPLTDAALSSLSGKAFPSLALDHTEMTDEAFRALNEIVGLEYVSFDRTNVTGTGAAHLKNDKPFGHLAVGGPVFSSDGLAALAKSPCTKLTITSDEFGDAQLMLFVNNDILQELRLPDYKITDDGFSVFFRTRRERLDESGKKDRLRIILDAYGNTLATASTTLDGKSQ